jgi:hypothetical protein
LSELALPPSASTTLVIVLGASAWPHSPGFQASEAFMHAAHGFRDYLLNPRGFGLPEANLLDLFDAPSGASDQLEELGSFLQQQSQALITSNQPTRDVLIYFVGHGGLVGSSHDFYLMPRRANASSLRASGIGIDALADVLREKTRQTRRYLFLDCYFAAAAFRSFQGGPDQIAIEKTLDVFAVRARSSGFPRKGTTLLCSSAQKSSSLLLPDESCTMFSRAVLDVLRNGDLHRPQRMSLRDLKELTDDRLVALPEKNAPRPGLYSPDQSEGDVADVPLFPNPCAEEERQHQAWIERQSLTPNETISPALSGTRSAQSSNTAAAGPFLPLTTPPLVPRNQPGQKPLPGVGVAIRITRRKVVAGLGLAGLSIAGGGIAWRVFSQGERPHGVPGLTPASTSQSTPTPTPFPLGTTLLTYTGHSAAVIALAWSPDGKRIASGSADDTVRIWQAAE